MGDWTAAGERTRLERDLRQPGRDVGGIFMTVGRLAELLGERPDAARSETVDGLARVLASAEWRRHRQAYFLFRSAADALAGLVARVPGTGVADLAMARLRDALRTADGPVHRAVAEALGGLPLAIRFPVSENGDWDGAAADVAWDDLLGKRGILPGGPARMFGRSVTIPIRDSDWRLVIKLARSPEDAAALHREAVWADRLRPLAGRMPVRFDAPRPIRVRGRFVFRVRGLPVRPPGIRAGAAAIGLIAPADYFVYPNEPAAGRLAAPGDLQATLGRSAHILGCLAGAGIVHTAPIPLFHNRVQRGRREDRGVYEWWRGGRLDGWLRSCRYPNFGASGLRDLEHLESVRGGFYPVIGTHLLSLLLVIGSCFRNRDPERRGWSADGLPEDARDLFDRDAVRVLAETIFREYFSGFTGGSYRESPPVDFAVLADRMVEEMGVDRHMEEVLRLPDQERMSDLEFREFLTERGMGPREVFGLRRAEREIVLRTGPHLGEFNGRISLPEMIRFLETAAALCVAGRFAGDVQGNSRSAGSQRDVFRPGSVSEAPKWTA